VKQMKSKDRIALMICTSASGEKVPLAIVGKAKKPECFRLCENGIPPIAHVDQSNAWFDRKITVWWINHVFWPHHCSTRGAVVCLLLLDNCSAHTMDRKDTHASEALLIIFFFPPLMTNTHQPADMGMIAAAKVGCRSIMLGKLLAIFDVEGVYERVATSRLRQRRGCRGLLHGGKATTLDAMEILTETWNGDGKYARDKGLMRCWRKANMFPPCCHHFWRQSLAVFRCDDMRNLRALLQMISECWIDSRLDFGDSDSRISHPDARLPQHSIASFLPLGLQQSRPTTLTLAATWRKMHGNSLLKIMCLIIIIHCYLLHYNSRKEKNKNYRHCSANPENALRRKS
jgi:hypothetical protein